MVLLSNDGDQPRNSDPVGSHCGPRALTVLVQHIELEGVGVLPAKLEDVADLNTLFEEQRARSIRCRISLFHLCGLDRSIRGKITPHRDINAVVAIDSRSSNPPRTRHDARINQDLHIVLRHSHRSDVALGQEVMLVEILRLSQDNFLRLQRRLEAFHIHLAVAGDRNNGVREIFFPRFPRLHYHAFQGVLSSDFTIEPLGYSLIRIGPVHQRGNRRTVRRFQCDCRLNRIDRVFVDSRCRSNDSLNIGRIIRACRRHKRVLADGRDSEEFLGRGPTHRTRRRSTDSVIEP